MPLPAIVPRVPVRAYCGMWVVDCPRCPSALQVPLRAPEAMCWDCGAEYTIRWPHDPVAVETLLNARPNPLNRNWSPGETLEQLMIENAAHDCLPAALAHSDDPCLLRTVDQRVVGGALAAALPGPSRLLIGN
jgi:hypothetical protein